MAVIETWFEQDLQKAVQVQHLDGSLFSNNANGNRIGVVVYNNGVAASLSGTVSGYAVLPDGTTVPCTGSLSGNRASVLIPAAAYQPGIIFVSVFLTSGSTVTTLAAVAANVQQARTDSQVSPGSVVTDWTQTINAAMQSVVTANAANMAVEYGSLTYPVPVGQYTIYNDLLYRCITPIATAESWTASHWTRVRIADDVSDLKSAITYLHDHTKLTSYLNSMSGNKSWWKGRFVDNVKAWGMTTPVIFPYPITVYWCVDYSYGAMDCRVYTFTSPTDTNPIYTNYEVGKFTIPANTYFAVTLFSNLSEIPQDAIDRLVYACEYLEGGIPYIKDDSQFGVFGLYRQTRTNVMYAVSSKQIEYTAERIKITADSGYAVRALTFDGYSYTDATDFLSEIILSAGTAFKLMIQKNPLDTSETAVVSTYVGAINVEVYTDVLEDIDDLTDAQESNFDKCLKPAYAEFSSIGNANNLKLNQTYLVYGHDVASGTNLPEGLSVELDAWPAYIYTMQSTSSKGFQIIVSSNNIYFRTVFILSNGLISSGSVWRQLNDGRTYLKPAFAEFSSVGNANGLALNQTYLVYGHDVTSGSNLPEGLSIEIDFWPAYIYTMQATASGGFQVVVSSNNIFFRTCSISNGEINLGSQWRQLNNNQTAEKETSKAIEDATENALQTFETSDLYSSVNGAYLAKAIETDSIDCTPSTIYGVHESNIYIYNGYIYILCSTNKTDGEEDQTKYNIELIKTSLDGTPVLNTPVCSVGDTILGNTISKCQASFVLPIGDKIHIYVDVGISTMYKIFHTVYDIGTNTFSTFDEVYYVNSAGNTVKAETPEEQYICNHWFSYDGNDYCTAVYFGRTECGIAYTDDFTKFRYITKVNVDENIVGGEMTAEYVGYYGFDKLVVAYRTANNKRNCVFQQYDCTTGIWERKNYIPDATARPMFFKLDNELYLANNAPYTRCDVSIWHYITVNNWNNMGTLEPVAVARLGIPCTYFSFCMYNNNLYMIGICNNLTKVKVAVIEPETKSKAQINSTLLSLFT